MSAITMCGWFALCDRPAAGEVDHPVLGAVPTCQRCADRFGLDLDPFEFLGEAEWQWVGNPESWVLWHRLGYVQVFVPGYPRRVRWVVGRPESEDGTDPGAEYATGLADSVAQAMDEGLTALLARGAEA